MFLSGCYTADQFYKKNWPLTVGKVFSKKTECFLGYSTTTWRSFTLIFEGGFWVYAVGLGRRIMDHGMPTVWNSKRFGMYRIDMHFLRGKLDLIDVVPRCIGNCDIELWKN